MGNLDPTIIRSLDTALTIIFSFSMKVPAATNKRSKAKIDKKKLKYFY